MNLHSKPMSLTHRDSAPGPEISHLVLPPSTARLGGGVVGGQALLRDPTRSPAWLLSEYWAVCLLLL